MMRHAIFADGSSASTRSILAQERNCLNKNSILLIAASLLPAYAIAAKLSLKQDLSGLDLAATENPSDSPRAIAITNNSAAVVACTLTYTGADAGPSSTITIQPGKASTMRVAVDASNFVRSGNLKCVEPQVAPSAFAKRE
jgi:hypothetical protein